jgi:hypothetical protein
MSEDLICPECCRRGFNSNHVWDDAAKIKCRACGEWSDPKTWFLRLSRGQTAFLCGNRDAAIFDLKYADCASTGEETR